MNSCVAGLNVAVGRAGTISAMPVSSRFAELLYDPNELASRPKHPTSETSAAHQISAAGLKAAQRRAPHPADAGSSVQFPAAAIAAPEPFRLRWISHAASAIRNHILGVRNRAGLMKQW
jgi:hypothetical protein